MVTTQLPTITPRYIFETRRYLAMAAGVGLVAVLLLVIGLVPQLQVIVSLQGEVTTQQEQVNKLDAKVKQLEQVLSPDLLAQIQTVDILLPSRKPLLELLASLNNVANLSGVSYSGIELSPGSIATESAETGKSGPTHRGSIATGGSSDADSLEVKLKVSGSLDQLNQFFDLVEQTAPISTIISLSLAPQHRQTLFSEETPNQVSGDLYDAEVTVATAYFTRSVSAAVSAPLPKLSQDQQQFLSELAQFTIEELAPQQEVMGGGLDDLFGVEQPPTGVQN